MKIKLLENMKSCITDGERLIPKGTVMTWFATSCTWTYFKGDGFTLIIMDCNDWSNVVVL